MLKDCNNVKFPKTPFIPIDIFKWRKIHKNTKFGILYDSGLT